MWRRISRSLSARLLAIFVLTAVMFALVSHWTVQLVLDSDNMRRLMGSHVSLYAEYLLADIGQPPDTARAQAITDTIPVDIRIEGPDLSWASDSAFPVLSELDFATRRDPDLPDDGSDFWIESLSDAEFATVDRHRFLKVRQGRYDIVMVSPKIARQPHARYSALTVILVALAVLFLCYAAVQWLIRPLQWIREGAARIGGGELDYRIPVARADELGELTTDINQMADDVRAMLEAKRQLLLAISHELRSPLTRTKVALEFLEDDGLRGEILSDIKEMEEIIGDLLEGEQLNRRHARLQLSRVSLGALIEALVNDEFAADTRRIARSSPSDDVELEVDTTRVRLMLKNLIENALRHNSNDVDAVNVILSVDDGQATIAVRDHGEGIAAEHLPHLTEPFYRADASRRRATGGYGLGLYLSRLIAEAHRGSLMIESVEGEGTTVRVSLPL